MYASHGFAFLSMLALATSTALPVSYARELQTRADTPAGVNIQTFTISTPEPYSFPAPAVYYDSSASSNAYTIVIPATDNNPAESERTFNNAQNALQESCNQQQQICNTASNDGSSGVTTQQCGDQQQKCQQAIQTIAKQYDQKQKNN